MMKSLFSTLSLTVFALFLSGCQTTQIADVQPGETPPADSDIGGLWFISDKVEKKIRQAPNRIYDAEVDQYLKNLVCRLSREYCEDISIYLLDFPYFNAFMMPNGTMVVWSGLFLRAETESQLAFVLAHELGHFTKQHGVKNFRRLKNAENMLTVLSMVSPIALVAGSVAASGALYKYSRDFEREADLYSVQVMQESNLNPGAGAELFGFVQEEDAVSSRQKRSLFFSTHPSTKERIETLSSYQQPTLETTDDQKFNDIKQRYLDSWLKGELSKRNYAGSEYLLTRLKKTSNHPKIDYYLAELYRKRGDEGDLEKSLKNYQSYADGENIDASVYKKIGQIHSRLGNNHRAISSLSTYLKLNPSSSDTGYIKQLIKKIKDKL